MSRNDDEPVSEAGRELSDPAPGPVPAPGHSNTPTRQAPGNGPHQLLVPAAAGRSRALNPRRSVGIKDVAREAGVSHGTVSNVLNHPERVSEARRQRVTAAIEKLGFVRDDSARQLKSGRSQLLGLVLMDAWNPFFNEVARGVEDCAVRRGWSVLAANSARRPERESHYLSLFEQRRADGLVVAPIADISPRLRTLRSRGIPSTLIGNSSQDPELLSVALDDRRGGRLAMAHLLDQGHRRIAFVGSVSRVLEVRDRHQGALDAISAAGADAELTVLEPDEMTVAAGATIATKLYALPPDVRPTAVFASNDQLAIGCLQVFGRHGITVPAEIAVVGFDDIEFASQASVPLTSVVQPAYQMGYRATEILLDEIAGTGDTATRHIRFEPELRVRQSTTAVSRKSIG